MSRFRTVVASRWAKRGGGRRVGQVVGGHVDGLHRGDRTLVGRGDALLQVTHLGGQGGLIAHGRRDAAQQSRHFGAGLGEAEDVVDEQQHVLAFFVTEVFRDRQAGQGDAGAGAGRLVHLAVDQGATRAFRRAVVGLRVGVDVGLDHLVIEVVAFAGAFAHAGQNRITAVSLGDVVDQFLHRHGLADAGAAEQADLAALGVGAHQVDDLDARDQDFSSVGLLGERRGVAVDGAEDVRLDRALFVDRLADDVHDAAQGAGTDRNADRLAGVAHGLTANEAFGGVHGDGADGVLTQVLGDFEHQALAGSLVDGFQGVQDRRQFAGELDVDDGADDLNELAGRCADGGRSGLGRLRSRSLGGGGLLGGRSLGGGGGSGGGRLRSGGGLLHGCRACQRRRREP